MRKIQFINSQFYHICNRGVDKRIIFQEKDDVERFFQSMKEFNTVKPIGSIYENSFNISQLGSSASKLNKLVNFICYHLLSNHYHFILEQLVDNGVPKLMHRVGTGYTKYFNEKYKRSGALFQGAYKAVHIKSDSQLLHTSAYVNLNDKVHQLGSSASKLVIPKLQMRSSWDEYMGKVSKKDEFCVKDIILGQFKNIVEYKKFAEEALERTLERREEMKDLLIE